MFVMNVSVITVVRQRLRPRRVQRRLTTRNLKIFSRNSAYCKLTNINLSTSEKKINDTMFNNKAIESQNFISLKWFNLETKIIILINLYLKILPNYCFLVTLFEICNYFRYQYFVCNLFWDVHKVEYIYFFKTEPKVFFLRVLLNHVPMTGIKICNKLTLQCLSMV